MCKVVQEAQLVLEVGSRGSATMSDAPVRVERTGPVTTIILARPERRNAVDRETADALVQAVLAFDRDSTASVGVLWGEGAFCAGANLKAVGRGLGNRLEDPSAGLDIIRDAKAPMGPTRLLVSKPVIAGIAGYAVAGGLELALWCDMRVAEE